MAAHAGSSLCAAPPAWAPTARRGAACRRRGGAIRAQLDQALEPALAVLAALPPPAAAASLAPAQPLADLSDAGFFELVNQTNDLVASQLTGLSPLSFAVVLGAGLLTSLSPCTLSVLPLTIGACLRLAGEWSGSDVRCWSEQMWELHAGAEAPPRGRSRATADACFRWPRTRESTPPLPAPSRLPGYIGGYSGSSSSGGGSGGADASLLLRAGAFSGGLATTLAALGVASSLLGGAYGQVGFALSYCFLCHRNR